MASLSVGGADITYVPEECGWSKYHSCAMGSVVGYCIDARLVQGVACWSAILLTACPRLANVCSSVFCVDGPQRRAMCPGIARATLTYWYSQPKPQHTWVWRAGEGQAATHHRLDRWWKPSREQEDYLIQSDISEMVQTNQGPERWS